MDQDLLITKDSRVIGSDPQAVVGQYLMDVAKGCGVKETLDRLGITPAQLVAWRHGNPEFVELERQAAVAGARGSTLGLAKAALESLAAKGVAKLDARMDSADETVSLRAANSVLDRVGLKAQEKGTSTTAVQIVIEIAGAKPIVLETHDP